MHKHASQLNLKSNRLAHKAVSDVLSCGHCDSSCKPPLYRDHHNTEILMGSIGLSTKSSMGDSLRDYRGEIETLKFEVEILRTEVDHLYELISNMGGLK